MKKSELLSYLTAGREIEFSYDEKMYSITHIVESNVQKISFCEFYQEDETFDSVESFVESAMIGDERLTDIISLITDVVVY